MGGASSRQWPGQQRNGRFLRAGRCGQGKKHGLCAQHLPSRALVDSKTRRRMSQSVFQVTSMSELGPPETRILSEKPRPATPAVGTARQGRVMFGPLVAGLIAWVDGLAQHIAEAYAPGWLHGVGRRRQNQKQPGTIGLLSLRGMPEAVVSNLVKAARQDVLKKAPEKLNPRQPLGAPRVGGAVFPAEGDMRLIHAENPCVGDRRAKDIPRQIAHNGVVTTAVVLAEGDPLPSPDAGRDRLEYGRLQPSTPRKTARRSCEKEDRPVRETLPRAGSQCWPSAVIPPPVTSRCTWG